MDFFKKKDQLLPPPWEQTFSLKIMLVIGLLILPGMLAIQSFVQNITMEVVQIADMTVARAAHQANLLPSGDVLITGGCTGKCRTQLASTEIYNSTTKTFRPSTPMQLPRASHVATTLKNGQVLIAGGWTNGNVTATAEIYDHKTGKFRTVIEMKEARGAPTANLLQNGRVLIAGGHNSSLASIASAEVFDPASSGFIQVGSMNSPRTAHTSVLLQNGKVLITGGKNDRNGKVLTSAEIFDPVTGKFQRTGEMSFPRHKHGAVLLKDGKVMIIGGSNHRDYSGRYQSTEIFDPATGRFSQGPDMINPRFKLPDAVVALPGGNVVVAGGDTPLEHYDQIKNAFIKIEGEYKESREFSTATLLNDGNVLLLGGYDEEINTWATAWLIENRP